jgi:RimJ/RimL family protein N-acetyltransferase
MRVLETNRLLIRPLAPDDIDAFATLMHESFGGPGDPDAYRARVTYYSIGDRVLEELHQPPYGDRAVVLKEAGALIGAVGFVPCLAPFGQLPCFGRIEGAKYSPEVGLFYAVASEHRRRGFAAEAAAVMARFAFDDLHLQRVVATTEYDNMASAAVMRRIGMTVEHNPWPTPWWFQVVGVLERPPRGGS